MRLWQVYAAKATIARACCWIGQPEKGVVVVFRLPIVLLCLTNAA